MDLFRSRKAPLTKNDAILVSRAGNQIEVKVNHSSVVLRLLCFSKITFDSQRLLELTPALRQVRSLTCSVVVWHFSTNAAVHEHSFKASCLLLTLFWDPPSLTGWPDPSWPYTGVSCGPPVHTANGVVRGAAFQLGDVAVYSCLAGYIMEGTGRSLCLENGTWTPPPSCRGSTRTRPCRPALKGPFLLQAPLSLYTTTVLDISVLSSWRRSFSKPPAVTDGLAKGLTSMHAFITSPPLSHHATCTNYLLVTHLTCMFAQAVCLTLLYTPILILASIIVCELLLYGYVMNITLTTVHTN